MYFDNSIVAGYLVPNGVTPSQVAGQLQSPLMALNQQINVLLAKIQSNPTPNEADILQLQLVAQQYNNLILLTSSVNKAFYDTEKQVISNIST